MSEKEKSDTRLNLIWGAPAIARAIGLKPDAKGARKVYNLSKTKKLPGLRSIGNQLVLDPAVTRKVLFDDNSAV
jgi:hypothetical protein